MVFGTLKNFAIAPYFQTREAVAAAGLDPGEFDITKPGKSWILDPKNYTPDEDGFVLLDGIALAKDGKTPRVNAEGKPFGAKFKVPVEELGKFNIPPKTVGVPDAKVLREYQLPLRPLTGDEAFDWTGFAVPTIVKKTANVLPDKVGINTSEAWGTKLEEAFDTLNAKLDLIMAALKG